MNIQRSSQRRKPNNIKPANKVRPDRYYKVKIPKKVRKKDDFTKAMDHIFKTLVVGNGETVDFHIKKVNNKYEYSRRYTDIVLAILQRRKLITIADGYWFSKTDFAYKKLAPSPELAAGIISLQGHSQRFDPELVKDGWANARNQFYSQQKWSGCAQPVVYAHKKHWRIYATGSNRYQSLSLERRVKVTVNGKRMAELDISGSHLTAMLGLHGLGIDETDPYLIPGTYRDDIKGAFKLLLGSTEKYGRAKLPNSWMQDADYRAGKVDYKGSCKHVASVLVKQYPFLTELYGKTWEDVNRLEAVVIKRVIVELERQGIVALSMHDGLLVEEDAISVAKTLLQYQFQEMFNIKPRIKVHTRETEAESDEIDWDQVKPTDLTVLKQEILTFVGLNEVTASSLKECNEYLKAGRAGHSLHTTQLDAVTTHKPSKINEKHGGKRAGAGGWNKTDQPWLQYLTVGTNKQVTRHYWYKLKKNGKLEMYITEGKLKLITQHEGT